jgi:hypothetical protein
MKMSTPIESMNAADFLKAWEKDDSDMPEAAYIIEGGPGEFMAFAVDVADDLDTAIEYAKTAKIEFGFFEVWVRETKTDSIVYKIREA